MVKIWARTMLDKRIVENEIFCFDGNYSEERFDEYVRTICHDLDIPPPVVLTSNINNFTQFNITRFKASDFVESLVGLEELVLENCPL